MMPFQIFEMRMPTREAVTINEDGSATIFVNEELCPAKKRAVVLHALAHLEGGDFYSELTADELEELRHEG